jgi:hypothetical protein
MRKRNSELRALNRRDDCKPAGDDETRRETPHVASACQKRSICLEQHREPVWSSRMTNFCRLSAAIAVARGTFRL